MYSESHELNSKADFLGKEARGFMGLVACGGTLVSMGKSMLLNDTSW